MADLFRISSEGQIVQVAEKPFADEVGDLEDFIVKNPQLLGEGVEIFGRQVSVGSAGRIDLLVIDKALGAGQIAVVELKNEPADVRVLLQALRYASWVVGNPDSIRLLLEKAKIKSEDADLKPRIVVVAPAIQDELVELTQYVGSFEFDLIELRRFEQEGENFVTVHHKTPTTAPPPGVVDQKEWNWEEYTSKLGWPRERIEVGRKLLERLQALVDEKGWTLTYRFRKGYIPFQLGGVKNVFGLSPGAAQSWWLWIHLPRPPEELGIPVPENVKATWDKNYRNFNVSIATDEVDLRLFEPLLAVAYDYRGGT